MTVTPDLATSPESFADWLLEQIAADETSARRQGASWSWRWRAVGAKVRAPHDCRVAETTQVAAEHIARWDPARVLDECQAKRVIIDELVGGLVAGRRLCDPILQALALPYADRNGYRQEWAP